ncbi:hypothetical protein MIDIC_20028 [Alphaproteobacteria bacterium]
MKAASTASAKEKKEEYLSNILPTYAFKLAKNFSIGFKSDE